MHPINWGVFALVVLAIPVVICSVFYLKARFASKKGA